MWLKYKQNIANIISHKYNVHIYKEKENTNIKVVHFRHPNGLLAAFLRNPCVNRYTSCIVHMILINETGAYM